LRPRDIADLWVRNQQGRMIPLGTLTAVVPAVGASLIGLYNLYPSSTIIGSPASTVSTGDVMHVLAQDAQRTLPPGTATEWSALSYQEDIVGSQIYFVFAMALVLVYLVLAGQYESWFTPLSVVLSVPLALVGPVSVISWLQVGKNLYIQIGVILLIALSAKNAILIVEVARDRRVHDGKPLLQSAIEAAQARFRPIIMTSIAFIFGVAPLLLSNGAGASARKSIGVTVFSGMIASTCLVVVFVPSFYVLLQRFEERGKRRAAAKAAPAPAAPEPAAPRSS
jgi:HAE1 family hydrophobic/amphiphilic exporter-1